MTAHFGGACALDRGTAVVGAALDSEAALYTGAAYVFVFDGTSWTERAKLTASDALPDDRFGGTVAVHAGTVVVGATQAFGLPGVAYVFSPTGATWSQQARLSASDAEPDAGFGWSVAIVRNLAVIGSATKGLNQRGAVYLFARSGATWTEVGGLPPPEVERFGQAVSVSGDTILVGGSTYDLAVPNTGAGYPFVLGPPLGTYCFGLDALCPCSNGGAPDSGCENARGTGGVRLEAAAFAPDGAGGGTATFHGSRFPAASAPATVLLRSTDPGLEPFGDGVLCLGTPLVRWSSAVAGMTSYEIIHAEPGTFYYQNWYRSVPSSYCDPASAFNTSNGLRVTWP